ncbi:MAG: replicative DNA helicase [Mogibacterium sp.]|nr:replicative DNA helicase [Mogibacterium sp.]
MKMKSSMTQPTLLGSPDAERAILGACIFSSEALTLALENLKPDDFIDDRSRQIFSVMGEMYSAGKPVDYITLPDELASKGLLERLGGNSYFDELAEEITHPQNIQFYLDIVRDHAVRRKILNAGEQISRNAAIYEKSVPDILEKAEKMLFDAGQNNRNGEFRHSREIITPVFANIDMLRRSTGKRITGYPTGFSDLNHFTGGLQPGSLNIIAARPSMGKTAFALNIAQFGGGDSNAPVLVFSLEMPAEQLVQRMISAESGVDLSRLTRGLFDSVEFDAVRIAADTVAKRNIYINDSTQLSAMEFFGRCRRFKMRHPDLALIVVDYLQLMSSGEQAARTASRQQEVSDISRMMKATAREMNCPVIALSQLSRNAENRTDKKPQLADLRDSGAIEQDADVVMMMFREDYYSENENNDLKDSQADIRIAKNRNGSTGVFHLTFKREITRFYNFGEI